MWCVCICCGLVIWWLGGFADYVILLWFVGLCLVFWVLWFIASIVHYGVGFGWFLVGDYFFLFGVVVYMFVLS